MRKHSDWSVYYGSRAVSMGFYVQFFTAKRGWEQKTAVSILKRREGVSKQHGTHSCILTFLLSPFFVLSMHHTGVGRKTHE